MLFKTNKMLAGTTAKAWSKIENRFAHFRSIYSILKNNALKQNFNFFVVFD